MQTFSLKQIHTLVNFRVAKDISNIRPSQVDMLTFAMPIGVSYGRNGRNGLLLVDLRDRTMYAITRNKYLLQIFQGVNDND